MAQKHNDRRDLLVQIAKLYYIEGLSQEEISKKVFVSRPKVSRLLKACLEEGIVQIKVDDTSSHELELANEIEEKFGIKKVIVTTSSNYLEESKQNVGEACALYLESILRSRQLVGIAWGSTLSYVVKSMKHNSLKKADVIQLLGGVEYKTNVTAAATLANSLASALNGDSYILHAPFMVKSKVLRDLLMDEPYIKQHFEKIKDVDIALIGLGSTKPELSAQFKSGHISLEDAQKLRNEGAVGDLCGRHIDINGNPCHTSLTDRILAISLEDLKKIPTVIGVATGEEKKDIIIGALRGNYLDALVIDKNAAIAVLEETK